MRRLLHGLVAAALIAALLTTVAAAHSGRTPTAGASKQFTNDQVLTYGYGAGHHHDRDDVLDHLVDRVLTAPDPK